GRYSERGLTMGDLLLGYLYQMPLFISWSMPIAALIATVFTVSNMARHSELAAAKAGGVSFFRLLLPLTLLGVLFTVLGLALTEIVPVTTRMKAEVMREKPKSQPTRSSFVYRGRDGTGYQVRRLDPQETDVCGLVEETDGEPTPRPPTPMTA